jgi:uncharacterized protein
MGTDCRQYLVVEHNGDVYPCDFYVRPELKLGNVMTHSWDAMLESDAYAAFGARKREWNTACEACRYLGFCGGCCPKNRPGSLEDPTHLSALCEGWVRFYDHALPGLRSLAEEVKRERDASRRTEAAMRREFAHARTVQGVGRNDPCPCGSGRKYKKCCGRQPTG